MHISDFHNCLILVKYAQIHLLYRASPLDRQLESHQIPHELARVMNTLHIHHIQQ